MKNQVTCPVCQHNRELPEGSEGRKWKCGGCASVHRILMSDGAYALKTLEESISASPSAAPAAKEMSMAAEAGPAAPKAPAGPKLQTRRSKFRAEYEESGPSKRSTRGSSRRTRR